MKTKQILVGLFGLVLALVAYLASDHLPSMAAPPTGPGAEGQIPPEQQLPTDLESLLVREAVAVESPNAEVRRVSTPLADLDLDVFGACLEARDEECLRDFILDWYQFPAQGVDHLLELLPVLSDGGHAQLLALLLKSAMVLMGDDPASFQPWDASSLIASCIGLSDVNQFMSSVLYQGLADFGAHAKSEDFDTILSLYGGVGETQFHDEMNQLDQIRLLGAWIKDLPEEEIPRFEASYVAHDITDAFYHGMGARFLIERDLQAGVDFVQQAMLDVTDGYGAQDPFVAEYENMVQIGLGAAFGADQPEKRGELLVALEGTPQVQSAYISQMDPSELLEVAGTIDTSRLDPTSRSLIALCVGGEEASQAVLDLLHSEDRDGFCSTAIDRVWREAIERGFTSDYQESVQREYEARSSNPEVFWSRIRRLAGGLESEEDVVEAILPWLEDSTGETSAYRGAVIQDLKKRFPGVDWTQ